MKKVVILGSTGSIGRNALKVIDGDMENYEVIGLSGYSNIDLLIEQIDRYNPKYICIGDEKGFNVLKERYKDKEIFYGEDGLKKMGMIEDYDIILTAVSGAVGIEATVEAIKQGKRIALANKETMVAGGEYINKLLKEYPKAEIIPVDSEHSAIFQSMLSGERKEIKNIIITASGGTFRGRKKEELENVTVEEALKHPNWSMGKKITIDSSTLMNKGLEVIEAHMLFGVPYENIKVLVHPQSIVHSMVEFCDNSIVAQLGAPDMKLPIQYAFTYPKRVENENLDRLDLMKMKNLQFEELNNEVFKGVKLAFEAGKTGKSMPIVYNSANEVAVDLFMKGKIRFLEIYDIVETEMREHKIIDIQDVETIKKIDKDVRRKIYEKYE